MYTFKKHTIKYTLINRLESKVDFVKKSSNKHVRRVNIAVMSYTLLLGYTHTLHKPIKRNPSFGGLFIV